jgi:SpoVK/Ycf46/Vps4 family AAA+-type ATPase
LVGESEANLRRLLSTAEAIAPCVLFLDEIEKALAGVNSANDSGVSQRLFGRLLTWMQEKTAPVFVLATANNIAGLPPEFTRKGRFDEIFFVDLPNALEREAILEAHLTRYGVAGVSLEEAVAATEGFSGAELAAVVEEALDLMDEDGWEPQTVDMPAYLQAAIKATRPLSERSPEALANLRDWAKASARPATQRLEPAAKPQNKGKVVMLG